MVFPIRIVLLSIVIVGNIHAQNFWQPTSGPQHVIRHTAVLPCGYVLASTDSDKIYRSTNGGLQWELVYEAGKNNWIIDLIVTPQGRAFANVNYFSPPMKDSVIASYDSGRSWNADTSGYFLKSSSSTISNEVRSLTGNKQGKLYASYQYNYKGDTDSELNCSTDNGQTWSMLKFFSKSYTFTILNVHVDVRGYIFVFAAGSSHSYFFRSMDDGVTWDTLSTTLWVGSISSNESGTIFVGGSNGRNALYQSSDSGKTFSIVSLRDQFVGYFVTNEVSKVLFCAASPYNNPDSLHIYRSSDNGVHWVDRTSGLQGAGITGSPSSDPSTGIIFIGTKRGVYKTSTSTNSVDDLVATNDFFVTQNYPNPTNGLTRIQCGMSRAHMYFEVRDILGRSIFTSLVPNGQHEIVVNLTTLPNGIYSYSLSDGTMVESKSMIIAR